MEAKPIDLEKVLSEISAGEKRSQRRSVIYTVVSLLIGDALQDRFAVFARQLVDRGKRVLAAER